MRVLSLFDGIACGLVALKRAGIKVDAYFASEIDKYAIQIAKKNHPEIEELGDVKLIEGVENLNNIDLLIGGSPCQGFSNAGKKLNFNDPRSQLFFEYIRILNEVKPKYFLLENVKMKKERVDIISNYLGVEPIEINSALVSGQNRKRLYWTNIPGITQPEDKGILLKDVLQDQVDEEYYYSNERRNKILARKYEVTKRLEELNSKCATLVTTGGGDHEKKIAVELISVQDGEIRVKTATKKGYDVANDGDGINLRYATSTTRRGRVARGKSHTLTTQNEADVLNNMRIRKLTPIEYERLQTLPDNYTEGVSKTQRYKMLGNGRTVDVIKHIFSFIPNK